MAIAAEIGITALFYPGIIILKEFSKYKNFKESFFDVNNVVAIMNLVENWIVVLTSLEPDLCISIFSFLQNQIMNVAKA